MLQPDARSWFVVYSKPRKEDFAESQLRLKGLEVFHPRLLLPKTRKRRNCLVSLFPSYLFVRFNFSEEFHYVVWSPGVKHVVSFDGNPTPLEDRFVNFLMQQATPEGVIRARSNLKAGQTVHINGGPFEGLAAIIQEPPDDRGRVRVLLELMSRKIRTEVPVQFVESGWIVEPTPVFQI